MTDQSTGASTPTSTSTSTSETRLNDGEGLEIAHEEDFGIARNDDGELLPVKQRIPGTDKAIKCTPLSAGKRQEYDDVLSHDTDFDPERTAALWDEHIVEGVGADATPELIESGIPYGMVAGITQALKNSSGEDVFLAVEEQANEELAQNIKLMDELSDEKVQAVANSLNGNDSQESS